LWCSQCDDHPENNLAKFLKRIFWCSQFDNHPENNLAKFLKRILWCSQFDNHPENNLAKFGCILDTKFRKKKEQNPSIFLATFWNLSFKSDDLELFFL